MCWCSSWRLNDQGLTMDHSSCALASLVACAAKLLLAPDLFRAGFAAGLDLRIQQHT